VLFRDAAVSFAGCRFFEEYRMLHPAAQILLWIFLTLALQLAKPLLLATLGTALLLAALLVAAGKLRQLLRRTRWIMLTLLLIYAWTTLGTPLLENSPAFCPTW